VHIEFQVFKVFKAFQHHQMTNKQNYWYRSTRHMVNSAPVHIQWWAKC